MSSRLVQTQRKPRHVELTPDEVKSLWKQGMLTPSGYLFLLLRASRRDGWKFRIKSVVEFCESIEMSRNAFYRAKAKLIQEGLVSEEIVGGLDIWVNGEALTDSIQGDRIKDRCSDEEQCVRIKDRCSDEEQCVRIEDSVLHSRDTLLRFEDSVLHSRDTLLHFEDTHPPQTQSLQTSCNSTDLLQISYRSDTTLSHTHPPTQKNENAIGTIAAVPSDSQPEGNYSPPKFDVLITEQPTGEGWDDFSAALPEPVENWRSYYRLHRRPPWRMEDGSFHPLMVQAAHQTGGSPGKGNIYDLPSGQINEPKIKKILRKMDNAALYAGYAGQCDSTQELQDLWELAVSSYYNPPVKLSDADRKGMAMYEQILRAIG